MKVAVIGAGIFGCTAAIYLARAGHNVDIFDKDFGPCAGASGANQFRLHRGYHYPRSLETAQECQKGFASFVREFGGAGGAVIQDCEHYYAIASAGTQTDATAYRAFLSKAGLKCSEGGRGIKPANLEMVCRAREAYLDPVRMPDLLLEKMRSAGVNTRFGQRAYRKMVHEYDKIVVAGYASTNVIMVNLGYPAERLQYEVVEKPLIKVPGMRKTGTVILDGPFCSVDPYGSSGYHLVGHVEHAIWRRSFGTTPIVPQALKKYVNKGVVPSPKHTKWKKMRTFVSAFIPQVADAEHIGSFFTIRAVLPDKDDTDERPTVVSKIDDKVIRVFSGKIPAAVDAAERVVALA